MEWIEVVNNVGFPIAISCYLLLKIEVKLNKLISLIHQTLGHEESRS
ncbi:YvrJ family protein [Abyssicoccus albus]|uniref:YvrJ-like protein n=1 Tax=Abyssicoccus albus TaxID=1817405 RepID=A0A3N5BJA1_9BACL|nr:YvrJ-like protein [Abyssicoccus albus]